MTRRELSFGRVVRAFAEKYLKALGSKVEKDEYFPRDFLRALGRRRLLGTLLKILWRRGPRLGL